MSDPRLSEQQVTDLFEERDVLVSARDYIIDRIREIDRMIYASGEAKVRDARAGA